MITKRSSLLGRASSYTHKNIDSIGPWGLYHKTLQCRIYFYTLQVFATVCHFFPSLIFAGKTRKLPSEWSPIRGSTRAGSGL
jgi:hypothetical protein